MFKQFWVIRTHYKDKIEKITGDLKFKCNRYIVTISLGLAGILLSPQKKVQEQPNQGIISLFFFKQPLRRCCQGCSTNIWKWCGTAATRTTCLCINITVSWVAWGSHPHHTHHNLIREWKLRSQNDTLTWHSYLECLWVPVQLFLLGFKMAQPSLKVINTAFQTIIYSSKTCFLYLFQERHI